MERILLMMAAARAADAEEALRSAAHNAVAPRRISYALSLLEEPSEMEIAALRRLGACQFLVPAADRGWTSRSCGRGKTICWWAARRCALSTTGICSFCGSCARASPGATRLPAC